jgi:hypothetical protein
MSAPLHSRVKSQQQLANYDGILPYNQQSCNMAEKPCSMPYKTHGMCDHN